MRNESTNPALAVASFYSNGPIRAQGLDECSAFTEACGEQLHYVMVKNHSLRATLRDEQFCLTTTHNGGAEPATLGPCLRWNLNSSMSAASALAKVAGIPASYFRTLLDENRWLAVLAFNHGISTLHPLGNVGLSFFEERSGGPKTLYQTFRPDSPIHIHHLLYDIARDLRVALKGEPELASRHVQIRIEECFCSGTAFEVRMVVQRTELKNMVEVGDAVMWGFQLVVDLLRPEQIQIVPIVWRLVCKNGMMAAEKGKPLGIAVALKDHLPSWNECFRSRFGRPQTFQELLDTCGLDANNLKRKAVQALLHAAAKVATDKAAERIMSKLGKVAQTELPGNGANEADLSRAIRAVCEHVSIRLTSRQLEEIASRVREYCRGRPATVWNLINALTNYAQGASTHRRRHQFEREANRLLAFSNPDYLAEFTEGFLESQRGSAAAATSGGSQTRPI